MRTPETFRQSLIQQSRAEIIGIIKRHWSDLTGCAPEDFDSGITFVVDSQNPRLASTKKIEEEIQILGFTDGGTVINVPDNCESEIRAIVATYGVDEARMTECLEKRYGGVVSPYRSIRSYLFTDEKLLPADPHVRKLDRSEKSAFGAFMDRCSEQEREEVYMDFEADFHNFFAYVADDRIAAIGEYCKIREGDTIVIPSIITASDCRKRGYGKAVVNAMSRKMLAERSVPQYRCDPENTGSRAIARTLGYEETVWGSSLRIVQP